MVLNIIANLFVLMDTDRVWTVKELKDTCGGVELPAWEDDDDEEKCSETSTVTATTNVELALEDGDDEKKSPVVEADLKDGELPESNEDEDEKPSPSNLVKDSPSLPTLLLVEKKVPSRKKSNDSTEDNLVEESVGGASSVPGQGHGSPFSNEMCPREFDDDEGGGRCGREHNSHRRGERVIEEHPTPPARNPSRRKEEVVARPPKSDQIYKDFLQGKGQKSSDDCSFSHDAVPLRNMEFYKFVRLKNIEDRKKYIDFQMKNFKQELELLNGMEARIRMLNPKPGQMDIDRNGNNQGGPSRRTRWKQPTKDNQDKLYKLLEEEGVGSYDEQAVQDSSSSGPSLLQNHHDHDVDNNDNNNNNNMSHGPPLHLVNNPASANVLANLNILISSINDHHNSAQLMQNLDLGTLLGLGLYPPSAKPQQLDQTIQTASNSNSTTNQMVNPNEHISSPTASTTTTTTNSLIRAGKLTISRCNFVNEAYWQRYKEVEETRKYLRKWPGMNEEEKVELVVAMFPGHVLDLYQLKKKKKLKNLPKTVLYMCDHGCCHIVSVTGSSNKNYLTVAYTKLRPKPIWATDKVCLSKNRMPPCASLEECYGKGHRPDLDRVYVLMPSYYNSANLGMKALMRLILKQPVCKRSNFGQGIVPLITRRFKEHLENKFKDIYSLDFSKVRVTNTNPNCSPGVAYVTCAKKRKVLGIKHRRRVYGPRIHIAASSRRSIRNSGSIPQQQQQIQSQKGQHHPPGPSVPVFNQAHSVSRSNSQSQRLLTVPSSGQNNVNMDLGSGSSVTQNSQQSSPSASVTVRVVNSGPTSPIDGSTTQVQLGSASSPHSSSYYENETVLPPEMEYNGMPVADGQQQPSHQGGGMEVSQGPEALLREGKNDGEIMMVYEGSQVGCYSWSEGDKKWTKMGNVVGANGAAQSTSGKVLHDGKEYDYVFNVELDGQDTRKLPYNINEDPWFAAKRFIDKNELSPQFLDQVANFIITNTKGMHLEQSNDVNYTDPFTVGCRYVPGTSSTNANSGGSGLHPFTSAGAYTQSSHSNAAPQAQIESGHPCFPILNFLQFSGFPKTEGFQGLRGKLKSYAEQLREVVTDDTITVLFTSITSGQLTDDVNTIIRGILSWPADKVFTILDLLRFGCLQGDFATMLNSQIPIVEKLFAQFIIKKNRNQMLILQLLCNCFGILNSLLMTHKSTIVYKMLNYLYMSKNNQTAAATVLLNYSIVATSTTQNPVDTTRAKMKIQKEILMDVLSFVELIEEPEAIYCLLVALGNLLADNPKTQQLFKSQGGDNILQGFKKKGSLKIQQCAGQIQTILEA